MYKGISSHIKNYKLDTHLYQLHKYGPGKSDFGMDNTSVLLDNGFGLYSTADLKKNIGPVKTEYFRISLTRKGTATMEVGLESYHPSRNYILFGIPGQIFSLHDCSDDFFAYYMLFTEPFIADIFLNQDKRQVYSFLSYPGLQCFELSDETAIEIETIILKMNEEIKAKQQGCSEVIRLYIQLIMVFANRNYRNAMDTRNDRLTTGQSLFNSFLKLVSQHFYTHRKVSDYAEMLYVSPDHLNRAIKTCSAKTAHELIDEMIIMEAKSYLRYSSLTIAEISYQLQFADPSHFNRFFKKYIHQTPAEYRKLS